MVQNLSPTEMENHQKRGLCYNCDEKYSPDHKCKEQKLFHINVTPSIDSKELIIIYTTQVQMVDHTSPTQEIVESEIPQEYPIISLHALVGISSLQTLKSGGYIKLHKVVVLVDSGNTQNFICKRVVE